MALVLNPTVGTVNNAGVGTSVVVPTPAGFAAGDLLLCVVNTDSKSVILTAPAGWTLLLNIKTSVSLGNQFSVWTRVADGTEGASATVALSKSVNANGAMYAISGQDAAAPINVWATLDTPTASVSHAAPSVTPTVAGCLLISVVSAFFNGSYTAPAEMTLGSSLNNNDTTCGTASEAYAGGTAATGTRTFTATTSAASIGATIAIAPAVGLAFRGAAQASTPSGSSVAVAAPTGTRNGDLLVADVAARLGAAGAPAGWTLIRGTAVSSGQIATYFKIAANEGASFTFTGTSGVAASVLCFVSGDPPVLDVEDGQSNASSTSIAAPSIATRQDADLLIWTGGALTSSSAPIISAPSDMTLPANGAAKANAYVSVASAYLLNQPPGATGTKVGAASGAVASAGHLAAFAIAPAAGGGGGAAVALAGTAAASSLATAARLVEAQPLAGPSVAASAAAAMRLTEAQPLNGTAGAVSTASASPLVMAHALAGSAVAASAASASRLTETQPLAGVSAAMSAAAGSRLTETQPLAGTSDAVSLASAARVTEAHPLAGVSSAVSGASADRLAETPALAGTSVTTSIAAASALTMDPSLAGGSTATSLATATGVQAAGSLAGVSAGASGATADRLTEAHPLTGVSAAQSVADARRLNLSPSLAGSSVAVSGAAASGLGGALPLAGLAASVSAASARAFTPLDGRAIGGSSAAGLLTAMHALAGTAPALSWADAAAFTPLDGVSFAVSMAAGTFAPVLAAMPVAVVLSSSSPSASLTVPAAAARLTVQPASAALTKG